MLNQLEKLLFHIKMNTILLKLHEAKNLTVMGLVMLHMGSIVIFLMVVVMSCIMMVSGFVGSI